MRNKLKLVFIFLLQLILVDTTFQQVCAAGSEELFYGLNDSKGAVVQGIVEDNNAALGYITLYNEDGSGTDWYSEQGSILRTFYYRNTSDIKVYKNHKKAYMKDIEAGDSVFLNLGEDGKVISASAMDNYVVRYANVISKKPQSILVEFDNYEQMLLDINNEVLVMSEGRSVDYSELRDGDRIKLTLHITNYFTKLKYITIEGSEQSITAVYKGTMASISDASGKIILRNLQELSHGQWTSTDQKLFTSLYLSEKCEIFAEDFSIDSRWANKYFKGGEVYIAASTDYSGKKKAEVITFRNSYDAEMNYEDSVSLTSLRVNSFTLFNSNTDIKLSPGSIIIKDSKLVKSSSITRDDKVYVVSNRSYADGNYYAGIVKIESDRSANGFELYRGRIRAIDAGRSFAVESFSRLNGLEWEYSNVSKTFDIGAATRILTDEGILNTRDFIGYGENSYIGDTVYILASEAGTLLISTAPFGMQNITGEVYEASGAEFGEDGEMLEPPTALKIMNSKKYDNASFKWSPADTNEISVLKNSVILRDNKIMSPYELEKGDNVRVLCGSAGAKVNGYIIIVE